MKIGILITARLGSQRLKRKHLLGINKKPILGYLIDRILYGLKKEIAINNIDFIIATSRNNENRIFEKYFNNYLNIFYGCENNIPLRHLEAANRYNLDAIISVDGDDIFCSIKGIKKIYNHLRDGFEYVKTNNLPLGMNAMGYSVPFLDKSLKKYMSAKLETGWGRIFNNKTLKKINMNIENDKRLRFTLDYIDDFELFKKVILFMGQGILSATDEDIINLVLQNKIYELNNSLSVEYYNNFEKLVKKEEETI